MNKLFWTTIWQQLKKSDGYDKVIYFLFFALGFLGGVIGTAIKLSF